MACVYDSENTIFGPLGRDKARSQNSDLYGLTNIVGIVILIAKYQKNQVTFALISKIRAILVLIKFN